MGTATHRWNGSVQLVASILGVVALLQLLVVETDAFTRRTSTFLTSRNTQQQQQQPSWITDNLLMIRGGDADVDVDIGDIESSDEEEEEEELDPKLAKAAQAATSKVKAQTAKMATNAAKAAVASSLSSTKPKKNKSKSSSGLSNFFKIPYIIKATLNPFTFIQMTVEYWKSFVNPKYLDDKKVCVLFVCCVVLCCV